MTLRQALRQALQIENAPAVGHLADLMRFKLGLNYQESFAAAQRACPGLTLAQWDGLLYEADREASQG
jgi:hypothetical protein